MATNQQFDLPNLNKAARGFSDQAPDPYSMFSTPAGQTGQAGQTGKRVKKKKGKKKGAQANQAAQGLPRSPVPQGDPAEGGPERAFEEWGAESFGTAEGQPGDVRYQRGNAKGMTQHEAFQHFMTDVWQGGGSNRQQSTSAADLGLSRTDMAGDPIKPEKGYSKYGQPQDLDPKEVNPYRSFSTGGSGFKPTSSLGTGDGFQLRSEAERRERNDHYRFFDKQDANAAHQKGSAAVAAKKQEQAARKAETDQKITTRGEVSEGGLTRFYDRSGERVGNTQQIPSQYGGGMGYAAAPGAPPAKKLDDDQYVATGSGEPMKVGQARAPLPEGMSPNSAFGKDRADAQRLANTRESRMFEEQSRENFRSAGGGKAKSKAPKGTMFDTAGNAYSPNRAVQASPSWQKGQVGPSIFDKFSKR